MNPRTQFFAVTTAAVLACLGYGTWAVVRAKDNLVTLDVRDMDVRRVVRKIEWQTWETIAVHKDVQGKVTLNVRKMPLEQVLKIVGVQTSSRWSTLYPLYSGGRSFAALKKALRGEADPVVTGWTNLQSRVLAGGNGGPGGGRPGGSMGGPGPDFGGVTGTNQLVTLQVYQKDVAFAVLALNRFAQARVVPEDGTTATVNLALHEANVADAVALLAKKADRNWTKLYTLRGEFGPGGPARMAMRGSNGGEGDLTVEERDALRQQRAALEEELKQTLSEEDRLKLEQARAQREKQRQEMVSLTPEQRRDRMGQFGGPNNMAQRNLERIKNTTPEQRAQQRRQMVQRPWGEQTGQRPPAPR